jgi:hypothetical protein
MSRLAGGKTSVTTAEMLASDPAARLADYSGEQYYFITRSTASGDVASSSASVTGAELSTVNLPPDGSDSSSDKESGSTVQSSRREPKADHVIKVMY